MGVDVVVRVQMRRPAAHELREANELCFQRRPAGGRIGEVGGRLPLSVAEPHVEADAERRALAGQAGCLLAARHFHHQAGAGDDAPPLSFHNAAIHPGAGAEVVGVDDQILHRPPSAASAGRRQANQVSISANIGNPHHSPCEAASAASPRLHA